VLAGTALLASGDAHGPPTATAVGPTVMWTLRPVGRSVGQPPAGLAELELAWMLAGGNDVSNVVTNATTWSPGLNDPVKLQAEPNPQAVSIAPFSLNSSM
jgi:hypothetical protein